MKCQCGTCDAKTPHNDKACRRKGKWLVEIHAVDDCDSDPTDDLIMCQQCFDSLVNLTKRIIAWGMEGVRSPLCQSCWTPLVRTSSIIRNVELI